MNKIISRGSPQAWVSTDAIGLEAEVASCGTQNSLHRQEYKNMRGKLAVVKGTVTECV